MTGRTLARVERYGNARAFLDGVGGYLETREAEHNLLFGIAAGVIADPGASAAPPYLAGVRRGESVVGAAIMTPPWNVVLSCVDDPVAPAVLAADLAASGLPVPGATGPVDVAEAFARAWCEPRGLGWRVGVAERIYRLARVIPPIGVAGRVRPAVIADRDLLIRWVDGFLTEALAGGRHQEAVSLVDRSFASGTRTWFLWEDDGRPVSLAASAGPTPHGIRIGPVYTPPELRRHGYASAVTAAVSQLELDRGRQFVFLFTDLSNPTSNKIYQQIGYEAVIDVDLLNFVEPAAQT